jgi:hypothetical protein
MPRQSQRHLSCLAACLGLLAFAGTAVAADKLYKWKDADGVTHYGDAPPAQGAYEDRRIRAGADAGRAAAPAAAEDPQCEGVRKNLALLRSDRQLQEDADGDGKPDRILSQAERDTQVKLAEDMLQANCAAPAAT